MRLWCLYSAQVAGHGTKEPWLPLLFAKRVDTRTEVARWTREWTDNRVGFPLYGAQERDRLLQRAGRLLEQNVRAEDVVCRYGEAQFAAALMECPQMHVDTVAGRVSNNVEKLLFDAVNRERGSALGFLAGTASFPEDGASAEELFAKAEASLRSEVKVEG